MVIHGGAGTILRHDMTPELELAYLQALQQALDGGYAVLENGGTAVNAVLPCSTFTPCFASSCSTRFP